MEEVRLISAKTINNKEIILGQPILSGSNTLDLLLLSCHNSIIKYQRKENRCIMELNEKKFLLKISDEDLNFLGEFFDKEFLKANTYFNKIKAKKNKYLYYEKEGLVTTKEILETGFSDYYIKLTNYVLESLNTNLEDLIDKVEKSKDKLNMVDDELGKYYEFDLKSIGIGG